MKYNLLALLFSFLISVGTDGIAQTAAADIRATDAFADLCQSEGEPGERIVCANIGALDQALVYNRFGSFNPFGMMFALDRDISVLNHGDTQKSQMAGVLTADRCDLKTGAEFGHLSETLDAGNVRLKDCKRPRPIVLRVNVGDTFLVQVNNYLFQPKAPDFSKNYCKRGPTDDANAAGPYNAVSRGENSMVDHGEALCPDGTVVEEEQSFPAAPDWPTTRGVNLVVQGLHPLAVGDAAEPNPACTGLHAVQPGENAFICKYRVDQEGTYFFASHAAPSGGEGNGGSIVHGLFGAIVAQREGTRWYRSQTSSGAFDAVWPRAADGPRHARTGLIDYEATQDDAMTDGQTPLLNMARVLDIDDQEDFANARAVEIVHTDLNAIILCDPNLPDADCHRADDASDSVTEEPAFLAFREFSVFFHDELKAKYTRNFEELEKFGQLAGVKDGFAINYGASGMGSILLANRKGIGPSADCMECLYEEFFLTSWANGDPALLEWYSDDPSNVHHSYLNDPVVFRNFHAGPKETHVFHLHAHQWFAGNDPSRGAYLDSQTVAPQQGFTYNIYHGGLRGLNGEGEGWWDTQGSGNRNRTLGDSIFHCHLYPHFAQGMWALWRVHDVLEDGTRKLPDGQPNASLSTSFPDPSERKQSRAGTVDRLTGLWIGSEDRDPDDSYGTPVPAIIPLPGDALPLLPTYAEPDDIVDLTAEVKTLKTDAETPMPGFPFYVAGKPGHRPPQAPMDIARDLGEHDTETLLAAGTDEVTALIDTRINGDGWLDGGLGRHVIGDDSVRKLGVEIFGQAATALADFDAVDDDRKHLLARQVVSKAFALGDMSGSMTSADIELLPNEGTRLERAAMGFHHNGQLFEPGVDAVGLKLFDATGQDPDDIGVAPWNGSLPTKTAPLPGDGSIALADGLFYVNGNAPKPGSPFADPCATTSPNLRVAQARGGALGVDPFVKNANSEADYFRDPFLLGFRRYEVSAVQVDLVVNRAGWHDPQARINVFTDVSDTYKDNRETNRISPVISDTEEPFFFRAMSGECIEFRHTNELPKDLELDDFQVKTPTDTIGQHIHLVKFDVTSSDGSGNGWNYEDGTFAPDELATRICNAKDRSIFTAEELAVCDTEAYEEHEIWRLKRSENRHLFQTTVQRWFADPILTLNGDPQTQQLRDRTLRTVFTHDHFAPSSIQQHGFYSALLIEPGMALPEGSPEDVMQNGVVALQPNLASVCRPDETECVGPIQDGPMPAALPRRLTSVAWGHDTWEGSQRRIKMREPDPAHPDFREFALSIADFALLYDPRDRTSAGELKRSTSLGADGLAGDDDGPLSDAFGMSQLYCEAKWRLSPYILREFCGISTESQSVAGPSVNSWYTPGEWSPAWIAGGLNRDEEHKGLSFGDTFKITLPDANAPNTPEVAALLDDLIWYRQRAAGHVAIQGDEVAAMAKPVAPPFRPESISVDHHDPYLVNYRGAPLPLRIGDKATLDSATATGGPSSDCRLMDMGRQRGDPAAGDSEVVATLKSAQMGACSVDRQMAGVQGDMGEVLMSSRHGDAETPVFEAYQNELLAFRMIQGAQEVQHTFNIAGLAFKRNIDQHYPAGAQPLDLSDLREATADIHQWCLNNARDGRPDFYTAWRDSPVPPAGQEAYWAEFETLIAECDNLEGFTFAQEIGISEHFEVKGSLRQDVISSVEAIPPMLRQQGASAIPNDSSDYFYNFGSVDALWNGAWGTVRIYRDENSKDPSTVPDYNLGNPYFEDDADPFEIKGRLGQSLSPPEAIGLQQIAGTGGLACPLPADGESQKVMRSFLIAVQTEQVWDGVGTDYGKGGHDFDGLMLAFLSAEQLSVSFEDTVALQALTREDVIDAIRNTYNAPQPMTLRVNAGDCVQLRYINALIADSQTGGLSDRLGDAPLPPITPLNAGRVSTAPQHGENDGVLEEAVDPQNPGGLRPSASLALSIGLPGMDLADDLPLAFGYQRAGLPPAFGDGVTVSDPMLFYAGRMRLNLNFDPELNAINDDMDDPLRQLAGAVARRAFETLKARSEPWLSVAGEDMLNSVSSAVFFQFAPLAADNEAPGIIEVLGQPYSLQFFDFTHPLNFTLFDGTQGQAAALSVATCWDDDMCQSAVDTLRTALQEALTVELNARTHWIPYAFGPVPVRATGDVISHVQHGLFGAIDVIPRGWTAVSLGGQTLYDTTCPVNELGYEICDVGYAKYDAPQFGPFSRDGHPIVYTSASVDAYGSPKAETTREFILYYQDGLNLRDPDSRIVWKDQEGATISDADGPLKIVPDCEVCDDSYDLGEKAVSYRSVPHTAIVQSQGLRVEVSDNLNAFTFAPDFVDNPDALRLSACVGEKIVIRVVHPGGRARQRAFVVNGYNYDDLFPGFGFPRSALLAPGKGISAWLWPKAEAGRFLWHDGPTHIRAGGVWGLLDVTTCE